MLLEWIFISKKQNYDGIIMYIARNKNGFLWLFNSEPVRKEHCFVTLSSFETWGCVALDRHLFPEVTWENSPQKVVLAKKDYLPNHERAEKLLMDEGFFYITSVHRDDLEAIGFDTSEVTDSRMKILAKQLRDDYCNQMFFLSLEILAEELGIPKKNKNQ